MCSVASLVAVISPRLLLVCARVCVMMCSEESGPVSSHVFHIATHMAPPLCQLCSLGFLIINKMTDECNNEHELDFVFCHRAERCAARVNLQIEEFLFSRIRIIWIKYSTNKQRGGLLEVIQHFVSLFYDMSPWSFANLISHSAIKENRKDCIQLDTMPRTLDICII